jgi:hypothetical protein
LLGSFVEQVRSYRRALQTPILTNSVSIAERNASAAKFCSLDYLLPSQVRLIVRDKQHRL